MAKTSLSETYCVKIFTATVRESGRTSSNNKCQKRKNRLESTLIGLPVDISCTQNQNKKKGSGFIPVLYRSNEEI